MTAKSLKPLDKIVPVEKIPALADIQDVPIDDLMAVYKVCLRMEMICEHETGIGLSAVQIGIPWKLFIVRGNNTSKYSPLDKYAYFLNCSYEPVGDERFESLEGCLSLRAEDGRLRHFQVERSKKIRLTGWRLVVGKELSLVPIDDEVDFHEQSVVFSHEIDHHRGVLISEIGKEVFVWRE